MKVEESIFANQILQKHSFTFGDFFFFENFIVSEVKEGALFNWSTGKKVLEVAAKFYPSLEKLHYISNRIYDYGIDPQGWAKFSQNKYKLKSFIVVTYTETGLNNMLFEKIFYPSHIKRFESLGDAIKAIKQNTLQH